MFFCFILWFMLIFFVLVNIFLGFGFFLLFFLVCLSKIGFMEVKLVEFNIFFFWKCVVVVCFMRWCNLILVFVFFDILGWFWIFLVIEGVFIKILVVVFMVFFLFVEWIFVFLLVFEVIIFLMFFLFGWVIGVVCFFGVWVFLIFLGWFCIGGLLNFGRYFFV